MTNSVAHRERLLNFKARSTACRYGLACSTPKEALRETLAAKSSTCGEVRSSGSIARASSVRSGDSCTRAAAISPNVSAWGEWLELMRQRKRLLFRNELETFFSNPVQSGVSSAINYKHRAALSAKTSAISSGPSRLTASSTRTNSKNKSTSGLESFERPNRRPAPTARSSPATRSAKRK